MPKLPRRLPYEALVLSALALGSCSEGAQYISRDDAIEIARTAAGDTDMSALTDRLDAADARIEALIEADKKFEDLPDRVETVERKVRDDGLRLEDVASRLDI